MSKLRFVVLGDTHFCTDAIRRIELSRKSLGDIPDAERYVGMVSKVLEPLLTKIKSLEPDLLISTGDFVEGGMHSRAKTFSEMCNAWKLLRQVGCPVIIAKGTHEDSEAFREIVVPEMSAALGDHTGREHFSFDCDGNVFFILDYMSWDIDNGQLLWLKHEIAKVANHAKHIFIVAHPPIYSWGRHFFHEPEFAGVIDDICRNYPVDAYLCGHSHNQSVSFHGIDDSGKGFLQIMASSVGYPEMQTAPLCEFHSVAEFSESDRLLWGICEDSSPGFYLFETRHNGLDVQWFSVEGNHGGFIVGSRRAFPQIVSMPAFKTCSNKLKKVDLHQIIGGWFYCYGFCRDNDNTRITLNDISIGMLPRNTSYAARKQLPIQQDALSTVNLENEVKLTLPRDDDFVIGSISLEVLLYDGRRIHSKVAPEIFICGDIWKQFSMPRQICRVGPGATVDCRLMFTPF